MCHLLTSFVQTESVHTHKHAHTHSATHRGPHTAPVFALLVSFTLYNTSNNRIGRDEMKKRKYTKLYIRNGFSKEACVCMCGECNTLRAYVSPLTTTIRIVLFNLFIFVWTEIKRRKEMAHTHTTVNVSIRLWHVCVPGNMPIFTFYFLDIWCSVVFHSEYGGKITFVLIWSYGNIDDALFSPVLITQPQNDTIEFNHPFLFLFRVDTVRHWPWRKQL